MIKYYCYNIEESKTQIGLDTLELLLLLLSTPPIMPPHTDHLTLQCTVHLTSF